MNISKKLSTFPQVEFNTGTHIHNLLNFPEFKYRADLRFVRIYLDTPTFDKIIKDQSSKIEDKISTIGGNLGLLLGEQIISDLFSFISSLFAQVSP